MARILTVTLLVVAALAGCSSTAPVGLEEHARLLLAKGEASYELEPAEGRSQAWRDAICASETAAEHALKGQLRDLVTASWAEAALMGGNGLPSLTERTREQVVSGMMDHARIVSSGERQSGVVESYAGVRLPDDLAGCLHQSGADAVADHCTLPPEAEPMPGCEQVPEPPEVLYYLQ